MQFRDLKLQYKRLSEDINNAIFNVVNNANFINGHQVQELEKDLAEYVGKKHCITCGNGTDALTLALRAWGIKQGDACFVPDFTFFASAEAAALIGATPIFIDIDNRTFNIDPDDLEKKIQKVLEQGELLPKAIIAVDLFGLPADYSAIKVIAQKYNLKILEDAAQGFGGQINGLKACSFGDISVTSFFPAKPLGCYGDGGAIFTDDDNINDYIRSLCCHGKGKEKYDNIQLGVNSRLDTVQAAILQVKFNAFVEYELHDINKRAKIYNHYLGDIVQVPFIPHGYRSSWAQYSILLKNKEQREGLQKYLGENSIPCAIYYPKTLSQQKAFSSLKAIGYTENSRDVSTRILSLPIHPYLKEEEIFYICEQIRNYFYKEVM